MVWYGVFCVRSSTCTAVHLRCHDAARVGRPRGNAGDERSSEHGGAGLELVVAAGRPELDPQPRAPAVPAVAVRAAPQVDGRGGEVAAQPAAAGDGVRSHRARAAGLRLLACVHEHRQGRPVAQALAQHEPRRPRGPRRPARARAGEGAQDLQRGLPAVHGLPSHGEGHEGAAHAAAGSRQDAVRRLPRLPRRDEHDRVGACGVAEGVNLRGDVPVRARPGRKRTAQDHNGTANFSSNAWQVDKCREAAANARSSIQDADLSFAIVLENVRLMVGEWIPFGPNQIVLLNDRLGALERCQGGLFTSELDDAPTSTSLFIAPGLTKIAIVDFDFDSFTNFEADIYTPIEDGIIQIESFGMHLNGDGSIMYGMEIDATMDRSADFVCVDHLARLLVDVDLDSSKIINDLLSPHQRALMDILFMGDARSRNKFALLTASGISPKLPARAYLDRGEKENELKQVLGELHSVHDIGLDDKLLVGHDGMLLAGPNANKHEPLLVAHLALLSRELVVRFFFKRTFILGDVLARARNYMTSYEMNPEAMDDMRDRVSRCAHDLVLLEEILELLRESLHGLAHTIPARPTPANDDPTGGGAALYDHLQLRKTHKDLDLRCKDLAKLLRGFRAKLKQVQSQNGTMAKTMLEGLVLGVERNVGVLAEATRANQRSLTDSFDVLLFLFAGILAFELMDRITDGRLLGMDEDTAPSLHWIKDMIVENFINYPALWFVADFSWLIIVVVILQAAIRIASRRLARTQRRVFADSPRRINVAALEQFIRTPIDEVTAAVPVAAPATRGCCSRRQNRAIESRKASVRGTIRVVKVLWSEPAIRPKCQTWMEFLMRVRQNWEQFIAPPVRTQLTYDATNGFLIDVIIHCWVFRRAFLAADRGQVGGLFSTLSAMVSTSLVCAVECPRAPNSRNVESFASTPACAKPKTTLRSRTLKRTRRRLNPVRRGLAISFLHFTFPCLSAVSSVAGRHFVTPPQTRSRHVGQGQVDSPSFAAGGHDVADVEPGIAAPVLELPAGGAQSVSGVTNQPSEWRDCLGSSDDENDAVQVLSIRTRGWNQGDNNRTRDDTVDSEMSSSSKRSLLWQLLAPKVKTETNQATVMYSISFYPWKMEPHGYYSHPEAAANWVPDTASARCQICLSSFTLTRRRHHCRLCGHLVCANCSHDRTYLPFAGSAPSQHRLIKDGAPQRTCSSCASTLRNMAGQDDPRVKRFTVAVSSTRRRKSTTSATSISMSASRSVVEVEVERPSPWLRRTGMALTDSDIEDEEAEELDEILSARACSRVRSAVDQGENLGSRQFVISSAWLDQWLQYVRVDSASAEAASNAFSKGQRGNPSTKCRMARPPRPGPVTNYTLLDFVNGELVPKPNLQRSKGSHGGGDYRVVSQEVWVTFLELYGGGPSIQVPLNNDVDANNTAIVSGNRARSPVRRANLLQWIISELDDSAPILAVSPPIEKYSAATRKGASRGLGNQANCKAVQHHSTSSSRPATTTHSTSRKRLVSAASMSSLVKKTTGRFALRCESPRSNSSSRWKLFEEGSSRVRAETMMCERTAGLEEGNKAADNSTDAASRSTTGDAGSTFAAVSAFANAATLARKRSAISLTRHSAVISSRTNGSMLETQ
ncbi:hypothetical protein ON010_g7914 [Phytophthora cinnamomi]|nr:hypothetical protein ON010_g7914 [Phytophthora cinnamomi]